MKKIYLFPKDALPETILAMLDVDKIERVGVWLRELPPTKRGHIAYRMSKGINNIPAVVFSRTYDAVAFRLKFGL